MDSYPAALLTGTLLMEGSCLAVQPQAGVPPEVVVWPADYRLRTAGTPAVVDGTGRLVAAVGDLVQLGGGEYHLDDIGQFLVPGTAIPPACRSGPFWLATPR